MPEIAEREPKEISVDAFLYFSRRFSDLSPVSWCKSGWVDFAGIGVWGGRLPSGFCYIPCVLSRKRLRLQCAPLGLVYTMRAQDPDKMVFFTPS